MNLYEVNDPCNREDIKEIQCPECNGEGGFYVVANWLDPECPMEFDKCEHCEGTGKIESEY